MLASYREEDATWHRRSVWPPRENAVTLPLADSVGGPAA